MEAINKAVSELNSQMQQKGYDGSFLTCGEFPGNLEDSLLSYLQSCLLRSKPVPDELLISSYLDYQDQGSKYILAWFRLNFNKNTVRFNVTDMDLSTRSGRKMEFHFDYNAQVPGSADARKMLYDDRIYGEHEKIREERFNATVDKLLSTLHEKGYSGLQAVVPVAGMWTTDDLKDYLVSHYKRDESYGMVTLRANMKIGVTGESAAAYIGLRYDRSNFCYQPSHYRATLLDENSRMRKEVKLQIPNWPALPTRQGTLDILRNAPVINNKKTLKL